MDREAYVGKHRRDTPIEAETDQYDNYDFSLEIDKDIRLDDPTRATMKHNLVVFAEAMCGFSLSYRVPLRLDSPMLIWDENGEPLEAYHIDIYIAPDQDGNVHGFLIDFSSADYEGLTGDSDRDTRLNTMLRRSLTVLARQDSDNEESYQVFSSGIVPYGTAVSVPEQEISDGYLSLLHEIMDKDFMELTEHGYSYGDKWVHVHNDETLLD